MQSIINSVMQEMVMYEKGQPKHIQHFLKVHAFAKIIGQQEHLDDSTMFTLELASLVHDIGINPSRKKYNSSAGEYQQIEGSPLARCMLEKYHLQPEIVDRVCYLVAHHHTYTNIEGLDYQILVEADFLVNLYEDQSTEASIRSALSHCFCTKTGRWLLQTMFLSESS